MISGNFGWGEAGWGEAGEIVVVDVPIDTTSQWTSGLVDLTQDSATVIGYGTDWEGNIGTTHLFCAVLPDVVEASTIYGISNVAGDEQLTLQAPWGGPTVRGSPYVIHRRTGSLPRLARTDDVVAPLMTYTLAELDRILATAVPGLPSGDWVLTAGSWNDSGLWRDSSTWQD